MISSVAELPGSEWDALCDGRPYLNHGWLCTVAQCAHTPPDYRFLLFREREELVGAAACVAAEARRSGDSFETRLFGRAATAARLSGLSLLPAVICGVGAAHGSAGLLIAPHLNPHEQANVCHRLIDSLEAFADRERRTLIFNNLLATEPWRGILEGRGYARTMVPPSVTMPVPWRDFDGYLAYLKSRSRSAAKNARQEMRRCRESGIDIRQAAFTPEMTSQAFRLLQSHHRLKNRQRFPFKEGFLEEAHDHCGERAELRLAAAGEQLAAASFSLRHGATVWQAFIGMDHELSGRGFASLNLMFYAPVEDAVRSGVRELVLGPGSYETKISRGGQLVERFVFVRRRRRRWQAPLTRALQLHERWHLRRYAPLYARARALDEKASVVSHKSCINSRSV
ncbi:hypothetical protein BH24PSE2_BH24PSE2_11600 [soil metagenome]